MVDPFLLSSDIAANAISLGLPGALWAFLFLLAWERPAFAESLGFGRLAFWLLIPGAALASLAVLPFGVVGSAVVGVSLGGAAFPLAVGFLSVQRFAPPRPRFLGRLLAVLVVEAALSLLLVLPVASPIVGSFARLLGVDPAAGAVLIVLPVVVLVPLVVFLARHAGASDPDARAARSGSALAFLVALLSGVLFATFAASEAVPGLGILEPFPVFLLPPIAAGTIAVLVAPRVFPGAEALALPVAFLATTLGVLLGADLLRQPPLYGPGSSGLYTIGGAGILDLVYLSGLLALATAYVVHRSFGRSVEPVAPSPGVEPSTPSARLARSFRSGVAGRLKEALDEAVGASHESAAIAHRLLDLPPAPPGRPWEGLAVPGWAVADQGNLDASARAGTTDGREGFRGWLTARALVRLGRGLGQSRFGTLGARILGFVLDLAIVGVPSVVCWAAIALATPGGLGPLLQGVAFNTSIFAFIAIAFLYRAIAEAATGSTPGKRGLGLVVRDRRLSRPGLLASLVRNLSTLPVLTVVGLGGALAIAFLVRYGSFASGPVEGVALPAGLLALAAVLAFLVIGVGLLGAFGALIISLTGERQRLGDLLAGTWVVRAGPRVPGGATAAAPPAPTSPPGPGPSG